MCDIWWPQDDAVSTIFQWLYSRMEDVHSGEYSDPPPELPPSPWARPSGSSGGSSSDDGAGRGGSGSGSGAGGGELDAVPAEELAVLEDGSS